MMGYEAKIEALEIANPPVKVRDIRRLNDQPGRGALPWGARARVIVVTSAVLWSLIIAAAVRF
jgi:hypothetical protein